MEKQVLDRYNSEYGATSYTGKFNRRFSERINNVVEQRLVRGWLGTLPKVELALDVPCGYGRMYPLIKTVAAQVVECDWSFHLLKECRARHLRTPQPARGWVRATALHLPYPDATFDLVFSVRLCHHINTSEEREQYVREILRVSRRYVICTYFDAASMKNRRRELKRRFKDIKSKYTMTRDQVAQIASASGYRIVRARALAPIFSGHRYTLLERI